MPDEVNFTDLAAIVKIKPDSVSEKFSGLINSSYFDAANILGTLKQKGLIDFTSSFAGQNPITVTETGKKLIEEADEKAKVDFDHLDFTILVQLSNGKRALQDLAGAVNVRPKDLAIHLYKLTKQDYISYEFRNGNISISLTEKGFLQVKTGMPKPKVEVPAAKPQMQPQMQQGKQPQSQPQGPPISVTAAQAAQTNQQAMQIMQKEEQKMPEQPGATNNLNLDLSDLEKHMKLGRFKSQLKWVAAGVVIILIILAVLHFVLHRI